MQSFNRLLLTFVAVFLLVLAAVNLLFLLGLPSQESKPHLVDINRALNELQQTNDPAALDLSRYDTLESVRFLPGSASEEERVAFFAGQGNSVIRLFGDGYLRFDYLDTGIRQVQHTWMLVNAAILVMGILSLGLLLYVRKKLVVPFSQISDMPYQLSKGHLTAGLKQDKNRYFGRFIWGLDLLRQTLETRRKNEIELTRKNKTMVLSLSHEVKTPLSAIRLYAKALKENLYDTEEKRNEIAEHIDEKAREIEGLVGGIIKTSKEDFLQLEVHNSEFYLRDLVNRVEHYYKEKLLLKKCELVIEEYGNLLLVGDIERYLEVFENIIENALKYGDGREIRISFPLLDEHHCITISNTGNTLDAGDSIHMWESFWRGPNAGTQEGSGLGLFICRQLMHAMKGSIYAEIDTDRIHFTLIPCVA